MELYLSDNKISQLKEMGHLRALPKLIILNAAGNPVANDPEYRLYLVYHLRRLKVR